jgi:CyaY protein
MSDESDFSALADRVLQAIGKALDMADADVDWTINDGVLTIDCGASGKLIVNRHVPSREVWVAAKAGGFHFRASDGEWRDTRDGSTLGAALGSLLRAQATIAVEFGNLPAPPRAPA